MRLHSAGSRSVLSRHRTLAAALDWSIALLDHAELRLFRRLSVFRGSFDVESALSVTQTDMEPEVAFDALISLVNKSLVSFDNGDTVAPYRLLDTTRCYAAARLAQTGEAPALQRRHALLMRESMDAATAELGELSAQDWTARYAYRLDDVRSALDTCLAQQDGWETGAALTIASAPLWFQVSQVEEYRDRVVQARWGVCVLHVIRGEYAAALHQSLVEMLLTLCQDWIDTARQQGALAWELSAAEAPGPAGPAAGSRGTAGRGLQSCAKPRTCTPGRP
ncbi:putative ATPase [Variovorax paradoxus]|uniref:hypothetical protein n=1 Tax=Variovorax paradoxus TaxID=34073 RepID=UPI00279143D5|nr:hypothetical protein [Variovorax paradoxus]MDQ0570556.1 putative ATPase [Variovorax paradoxus]